MKSGLLMSMPSAMKATSTPVPLNRLWACGTVVSLKAVLVSWSASGSSNGLAGSDGQTGVDGDEVGPGGGAGRTGEGELWRMVGRENDAPVTGMGGELSDVRLGQPRRRYMLWDELNGAEQGDDDRYRQYSPTQPGPDHAHPLGVRTTSG